MARARATKAGAARKAKARPRRSKRKAPLPEVAIPVETPEQAITAIAQDMVVILRRGLAYHAERLLTHPSAVSLHDCTALLRLLADIGPTAMKGHEGQRPNFEGLAPEERVQLAALLIKVDYA